MKRSISLFFVILIGLVACVDEIPQGVIIIIIDRAAPEVVSYYPRSDIHDVDPQDVHTKGITVVFTEPITGDLALLNDGNDLKWESKADSNKITLTGPAFMDYMKEEDIGFRAALGQISYETMYIIQGIVADNAGNETAVHLTFFTSEFPF